ncbi:MAG: DNA recombination protein RmuC [Candidatus Omnitrophica bacterium]|nr:DNA recombination protein RmuC [Candidatus Omnitrophota bacterium]
MIWFLGFLFMVFSAFTIFVILKISSQVNERLNQMNNTLQEANKIIGQNMGNATGVFGAIQEKLGRLEETNKQIYEVGRGIVSLQELLRAPKFRGAMGEVLLENLLAQVLPADYFQMQYKFKTSDTVDAVVKVGGKLVPVDAKFSLENFQKMLDAEDEPAKISFRKKFGQDVKNRIDEISAKYILPTENTYDFGLMYIPAENIFYEIIIKEDLFAYSVSKKVIPVSPNTFYAYLQVICLGLKGLQVEENAARILKNLSTLTNDIGRFREDFELVGTHLANASRKYEDSRKRLDRFFNRLSAIQEELPA